MAIRKTGSRRIVVDGVDYLWRVRRRPTYCQANTWGTLSVCIQRAERSGAVLVAGLDRPRPDNWLWRPSSAVRPVEVADLVRRALAAGWRPETAGPQFVFSMTADASHDL
jgi:hypothetical protein